MARRSSVPSVPATTEELRGVINEQNREIHRLEGELRSLRGMPLSDKRLMETEARLRDEYKAELDKVTATMLDAQNSMRMAYEAASAGKYPNLDRVVASMLEAWVTMRRAYTKN